MRGFRVAKQDSEILYKPKKITGTVGRIFNIKEKKSRPSIKNFSSIIYMKNKVRC